MKTLEQLIDEANAIHCYVLNPFCSIMDAQTHMTQLESNIDLLQSITCHMIKIQRSCVRLFNQRFGYGTRRLEPFWGTMAPQMPPPAASTEYKLQTREVAPNVQLRVLDVQSADNVPDIPLCWVRDTQQFAMKCNGVFIGGHIGEIYGRSDMAHRIQPCVRRLLCTKADCHYWHPRPGEIRNFTRGSWLYADEPINKKNANMRHYGSRGTLAYAMQLLASSADKRAKGWEESDDKAAYASLELRRLQLMHDLLVLTVAENIMNKPPQAFESVFIQPQVP